MDLLCYASSWDQARRSLLASLKAAFPESRIESRSDISGLGSWLLSQKPGFSAVVIVVSGPEDASAVLPFRDLIPDTAILAVLSDHDPDSFSAALRFRPKFISYLEGDYSDLILVIKKMSINRSREDQFAEKR
jgi:hypothetical protein